MAVSVAMTFKDVNMTSTTSESTKPERLPVTVTKPSPYTFSLSHLTALDPNPLPPTSTLLSSPPVLHDLARDGAQSLINQLLLTCPITSTPVGVHMSLPQSTVLTDLPRRKPLPKPKAPTKWEQFAKKKGIGKFSAGGAKEAERRKKMVYDEEKGEWVPKWGYKGKNKEGDSDWLVELDDKMAKKESELDDGKTIRGEGRRERVERIKRQERKTRANERRNAKGRS